MALHELLADAQVEAALQRFYAGFSLPDTGFDDSLCEAMAVMHARATIERAFERYPDPLVPLEAQIRQAMSAPLGLQDVWCRPINVAMECLGASSRDAGERVAQQLAGWSARINHRENGNLSATVPFQRGGQVIELAFRDSLAPDVDAFLLEQALDASHHRSVTHTLTQAFDLIERFAPEYGPWVLRLLRSVIPLRGGGANACQSGSSRLDAGVCHMAFPCEPAGLAEMLVHEVTHQYYYLLTRVGRVEDGSDPTLYYSPAKRRGRPIYFILIAYHAFANVYLFSSRCLRAGYDDRDGHLGRNVRELSGWIGIFATHLRATRALTGLGEALWQPLRRACAREAEALAPLAIH